MNQEAYWRERAIRAEEKLIVLENEKAEAKRTLANIWNALGLESYEQCKPLTIWEHCAAMKASLQYVFNWRLPLGDTVADQMLEKEPQRFELIHKQIWPRQN